MPSNRQSRFRHIANVKLTISRNESEFCPLAIESAELAAKGAYDSEDGHAYLMEVLDCTCPSKHLFVESIQKMDFDIQAIMEAEMWGASWESHHAEGTEYDFDFEFRNEKIKFEPIPPASAPRVE